MKIRHQLKLLCFQVDKAVMCMDIASTFHIFVIIYQSFDVKLFWKILITNQIYLEHIFHPLFLYTNSSKFMFNLQ
jgi:hypothetical protein